MGIRKDEGTSRETKARRELERRSMLVKEARDKLEAEQMFEVGCRQCGEGANFILFTDGKGKFKAVHSCGHLSNFEVVDRPDVKGWDMRFFY